VPVVSPGAPQSCHFRLQARVLPGMRHPEDEVADHQARVSCLQFCSFTGHVGHARGLQAQVVKSKHQVCAQVR